MLHDRTTTNDRACDRDDRDRHREPPSLTLLRNAGDRLVDLLPLLTLRTRFAFFELFAKGGHDRERWSFVLRLRLDGGLDLFFVFALSLRLVGRRMRRRADRRCFELCRELLLRDIIRREFPMLGDERSA